MQDDAFGTLAWFQAEKKCSAWLQVQSHRQRMEEGVRRQMQVPVASWGVKEVCNWAEYIGLGQYRKRFLHHCIGGSLLLDLTEHNLKVCAALLLTYKIYPIGTLGMESCAH